MLTALVFFHSFCRVVAAVLMCKDCAVSTYLDTLWPSSTRASLYVLIIVCACVYLYVCICMVSLPLRL